MQRARIIIVDDDQAWVQSVAQLLDDAGLSVQAAYDGEQALDLLSTEDPSLVILDFHMPRINGLELLRQFREHDSHTPVLMISAEDQVSMQDRAMSEGATAFLRKPISASLLTRAIRHYVVDRRSLKSKP